MPMPYTKGEYVHFNSHPLILRQLQHGLKIEYLIKFLTIKVKLVLLGFITIRRQIWNFPSAEKKNYYYCSHFTEISEYTRVYFQFKCNTSIMH